MPSVGFLERPNRKFGDIKAWRETVSHKEAACVGMMSEKATLNFFFKMALIFFGPILVHCACRTVIIRGCPLACIILILFDNFR